MTAPAPRMVALLACMAVAAVAQQSSPGTETLDEVAVTGPETRQRERAPRVNIPTANEVMVKLEKSIHVRLTLAKEQTQVAFRRASAARQLPDAASNLQVINRPMRLEFLPDRLIALQRPWIRQAWYQLAANVDEADGVPAHIPFAPGVALVNLDHVGLRNPEPRTGITVTNAMHPQTRQCEANFRILDSWSEGTNPYVLVGETLFNCSRAARRRDGDLLFADSIPRELRRAILELYDPIASRFAIQLGSEPGNMFVAWWPESPRDEYRFQVSWNRNSLLMLHGSGWQRGIGAAQRDSLRLAFMREQLQRRFRDSPGPFTQAAVNYLLLLALSGEDRSTPQRLRSELPAWLAGCAGWMRDRAAAATPAGDTYSYECGLVLQFVYDAVARFRSAGRQDIHDTWRKLLDASFRRGQSGARPADFLASSAEARRIAQGLVDGNMDWPQLVAALDGAGVKLKAVADGPLPAFEVLSLELFRD